MVVYPGACVGQFIPFWGVDKMDSPPDGSSFAGSESITVFIFSGLSRFWIVACAEITKREARKTSKRRG